MAGGFCGDFPDGMRGGGETIIEMFRFEGRVCDIVGETCLKIHVSFLRPEM